MWCSCQYQNNCDNVDGEGHGLTSAAVNTLVRTFDRTFCRMGKLLAEVN